MGDEEVVASASNKKKKRKQGAIRISSKASAAKRFEQILLEQHFSGWPAHVPNYARAKCKPSIFPARHFCSVCGFEAPYTCIRCGMRFCSIPCNSHHRETRCLKFLS
eukprot:TRINITY_DN16886_c0_g1_i3.p1 TRINITY_DN16886_c0_g1~~TRINITY_DN16886_c0_g1_i3.p1  ORF type:complete len:115 (-),score=9.40 TRINITY_DN16886_c0_g1_i3:1-321(-)